MFAILLFFVLHWYSSLFMQTFLHHRYASHSAFTMSRFWERVSYLTAFITQGSSYVSPRVYAIMHRMHHAYADTPEDPHSPKYDSNFFTMMWRARQVSRGIYFGKTAVDPRFLKNLPDWRALDLTGHATVTRLAWIAAYVAFYLVFAPSYWWFLLLPLHILMVPMHGAIINWFAHKYGSVNFEVKNTSTNLLHIDLLMMGEAYHNNHHKHPSASNFGYRWYEFDPTYFVMRGLNRLGVIRLPQRNKRIRQE